MPRSGQGRIHFPSVHCKLDGPWGLSCYSAFEALKTYLGAVWKGWLWFFFLNSCHLIPTLNCFVLQRNKLDVPGWLFFILSKGWISQRWISSARSSAFMRWSENSDLSSWADLFHKRSKICLFLFEFSFERMRYRIKSKWWKENRVALF